jgi:hypothetical protein
MAAPERRNHEEIENREFWIANGARQATSDASLTIHNSQFIPPGVHADLRQRHRLARPEGDPDADSAAPETFRGIR